MSYDVYLMMPAEPMPCEQEGCTTSAIWSANLKYDEQRYHRGCSAHLGLLLRPGRCYEVETIEKDTTVADVGNMTSNVGEMFALALGGVWLPDLNGQRVGDWLDRLTQAVAHICAPENAATYKALNPANGWGSHDGAKRYLAKILNACQEYPDATIAVSY